MAEQTLSKYEEFLLKLKDEGKSKAFSSEDDMKIINSINEISIEIKRTYEEKNIKSQEYASQVIFK
jgi:hypothetical protein